MMMRDATAAIVLVGTLADRPAPRSVIPPACLLVRPFVAWPLTLGARSDESGDDETAPRHKIPSWAQSPYVRTALAQQMQLAHSKIFEEAAIESPKLPDIFRGAPVRQRWNRRTSSAVWMLDASPGSGQRRLHKAI